MITSKRFTKISIKARVAYGICCFENAILHCGFLLSDWSIVLSKMWSLTSIRFADEWLYVMAEYLPSNVLADPYEIGDCEILTYEEYQKIKIISENAPHFLLEIADDIFSMGTNELYGAVLKDSSHTLEFLQNIINKMIQQGIELPDVLLFDKFSFSENRGWGKSFTKEDIGLQ